MRTKNSKPLDILAKVTSKLAPGRTPYFVEAHLVKALKLIDAEGPVGRVKLAKNLALGEGTIRTLLKHLENQGLIETSKAGIILTQSGKRLASDLKSRVSEATEVLPSPLTVGPQNVALSVRHAADSIREGIEQRDAAMKVGALGATTLIFQGGNLRMPKVDEDVFKSIPAVRRALVSKLKLRENDVVIIGSADDATTAEVGALAAALETLKTTDRVQKASKR